MGNRTSVTSLAGTENYTLDALDRLTGVTYPNGDVVGYTYDANGNRLTKTFNGTPTNYTYDNADQLTNDGTRTYTYDPNGNTTAAGADTFGWDCANRMTGATVGGTSSTCTYDGGDAACGSVTFLLGPATVALQTAPSIQVVPTPAGRGQQVAVYVMDFEPQTPDGSAWRAR